MIDNAKSVSAPLVSVIMPTYNRATKVSRSIDSALAQTWRPIEIIVVDDGSTDQTASVLATYGDRIKYVRQSNSGPSSARNAGIRASNGQIISFLDSDDTWLPEKTELEVKLLQRSYEAGVRCCVCNARMIGWAGQTTNSFAIASLNPAYTEGLWLNPTEVLITRFLFFNQVVAVWRDTLLATGLFREDLRILEDYDLALRLSLVCPWAFSSRELVVWHGDSENSLSKSASELAISLRAHDILVNLHASASRSHLLPQRILRQRLQYLRGRIQAYELMSHHGQYGVLRGRLMLFILKVQKIITDRLPGYHRMITKPI